MRKNINRFVTVMLLLVAILPSCKDDKFLEEIPYDFLSPDNAYSNVLGLRQGISGLHQQYRDTYWYNESFQDLIGLRRGLGTDIAFHGENPGNSGRFLNDYINYMIPANSYILGYWSQSYAIIQKANILIAKCDEADPSIWEFDGQYEMFKSEALFFRAYIYRDLVSTFGDVPLVLEPTQSAKVDLVRTPVAEVYAQMEEDLKYAVQYLPKRGQEEGSGRITMAAAYHCLAEVYLNENKWALAEEACNKVLDGSCGNYAIMTERFGTPNDVFGSGDCWMDLFSYGNQNIAANTETIWAVQYEELVIGGSSWGGERAFGPAYFRWGKDPSGKTAWAGVGVAKNISDTLGRPVAWIHPTDYAAYDIWRSDWDNDIRNADHAIKRTFYYENAASEWNGKAFNLDDYFYDPSLAPDDSAIVDGVKVRNYKRASILNDTCQYIYPYFMKFSSPNKRFTNPSTAGNGRTHQDAYAMRVAEVILFRAEARFKQNNIAGATADINTIRIRANATPVSEANLTLDYILDERARELYGEEWRFHTLRRHGVLYERTIQYNNNPYFPGLQMQEYHELWPIPQVEIDLNIGAELTQNPGYTVG